MKKLNQLNTTLAELYDGKTQINIHLSDKPFIFHVVLKDSKGFDCKISSFGANLYARTNKGLNFEKYNSIGILDRELKRLINSKVETSSDISYTLSDEIYTF